MTLFKNEIPDSERNEEIYKKISCLINLKKKIKQTSKLFNERERSYFYQMERLNEILIREELEAYKDING